MKTRGGVRTGRGSAKARRARRLWLWQTNNVAGLILCWRCELVMFFEDFEVDRIVPGCKGGTYARHNIAPVCSPCNILFGNYARDGVSC